MSWKLFLVGFSLLALGFFYLAEIPIEISASHPQNYSLVLGDTRYDWKPIVAPPPLTGPLLSLSSSLSTNRFIGPLIRSVMLRRNSWEIIQILASQIPSRVPLIYYPIMILKQEQFQNQVKMFTQEKEKNGKGEGRNEEEQGKGEERNEEGEKEMGDVRNEEDKKEQKDKGRNGAERTEEQKKEAEESCIHSNTEARFPYPSIEDYANAYQKKNISPIQIITKIIYKIKELEKKGNNNKIPR